MVKNLPVHAEESGLILGQGTKILHAKEQLNQLATTTEAHVPTVCAPQPDKLSQ